MTTSDISLGTAAEGPIVDRHHPGDGEVPYDLIVFDHDEHPFADVVADLFGEVELERLGAALVAADHRHRQTDQTSAWHRQFYDSFDVVADIYRDLIEHEVREYMAEPFYFQALPTLRVHLPGELGGSEFHTDRQFGHPLGELNFWLPLTRAWGTNSVWIERDVGDDVFVAAEAVPGEIVVFNAVELRHGSTVNETRRTRVSFDFRCIPVDDFEASGMSADGFVPGAYYSADVVA
jgi:hypothetical protein